MPIDVSATELDEQGFYPRLLVSYELTPQRFPVVILADDGRREDDRFSGTVLIGGERYNVGDYRDTWKRSVFQKYEGSITLSNKCPRETA